MPDTEFDSKQVLTWDAWRQMERIDVAGGRKEMLGGLGDFRPTTPLYLWNHVWFGISPDDRPISTRDTSVQEIYAFDIEYK